MKDAFVIPMGKEELADKKKVQLSNRTKSDHLMFANVMMFWEDSCSEGSNRDFCWENFLSEGTLKMLDKFKGQFAEHLHAAKFLGTPDVRDRRSNLNSGNENLVRAVVCAGLYPNVAKLKVHSKARGQYKFVRLEARRGRGGKAKIHPKSVNAKEIDFAYPWMVYHQMVKSNGIFLHDCTNVSPLSLAFFGQSISIGQETVDGKIYDTVNIDKFVKLNCAPSTSRLAKRLRSRLDELLEYKISHPGIIDWNSGREGALMRAIVELLSSEVKGVDFDQDEAGGDEDDDY